MRTAKPVLLLLLFFSWVSGLSWVSGVSGSGRQGDSGGFLPFHPLRQDEAVRTAPDISYLLDAPAGKRGFLSTRPDGHFYFEDGTRGRFFGVNLSDVTCLPDHPQAERLAARIARAGLNLVRLTHMDAGWGAERTLFDAKRDDTRHLSPQSLDRLDYLLFQLRKRGVYVFIPLLVARKFKAGDGVRDFDDVFYGASIVGHFNQRLIDLQKEFAQNLLTHKNPYTGKSLLSDPQLALLEITNEDTLLDDSRYEERVPASYLAELAVLCKSADPGCDPHKRPFDLPTRRGLLRIEQRYYQQMRSFLRELGVRCPIAGSNWFADIGPAVLADLEGDFVSRQGYWDHPQGGWTWKDKFTNFSSLKHPLDSIAATLSPMRIASRPFVVMEWGFCWPNDFIAEGPMMVAAYASLQDWDALLWYSFAGGDWPSSLLGDADQAVFDLGSKPHVWSQFPAAALLFHRGDVAPAKEVVQARVTARSLLAGSGPSAYFDPNDALEKRLEIRVELEGQGGARGDSIKPEWNGREPYRAQGVSWSVKDAVLTVSTPRTVAVDGFAGGRTFTLGDGVVIQPETPFCVIIVTSLDNAPIARSRHLLITTAARAQNTGALYSPDHSRLLRPGRGPILLEPVRGRLTLPALAGAEANTGSSFTVYPLSEDGQRRPPLPIHSGAIHLGPVSSESASFWYEIDR